MIGDWNTKVGRQETPGVTGKCGLGVWNAKANRVLPRECNGHSKHPLTATQEKTLHMETTRWLTPKLDWLYYLQSKVEKLYTVSKNKTGSWLWLRSWTPYCQIQTEIEESGEKKVVSTQFLVVRASLLKIAGVWFQFSTTQLWLMDVSVLELEEVSGNVC